MANSVSHASLPYPIKNARFTVFVPFLDADGDPTDPTTPDTEVSQDGGSYADAAEEVTTVTGSNGSGYITLTGAETNNSLVGLAFKVASGPKATLMALHPRNLPILESGTAGAGAAGSLTLASGTYTGLNIAGCFLRTTGGTGGGGTGGANNQARRITAYNTSTRVATVTPNWETTPDNTTTYDVLLPEGILVPMLTALAPATAGRTLVVDAAGIADANMVKAGPSGSGTAQTAGDLAALINAVDDYVDTEVAAIKAKTDNIPSDPADASDIAAAFSTVNSTLVTIAAYIDTEVAAIKAKTDNLPADPADASDIAASFSSLATTLSTIAGYIDTEIAAIKAKTDNLPAAPAATSDIPTAGAVADAVWDEVLSGHATAGTAGKKLSDLSTGGGGGTTVVVTPTVGVVTPDTTETEIRCKVGATNPKSVAVLDGNDDPVDLTALGTLRLCIETMTKVDVEVIENADISISGADSNLFTFTPGAATVSVARTLRWSLRRVSDNYVILDGPLVVEYSALADS